MAKASSGSGGSGCGCGSAAHISRRTLLRAGASAAGVLGTSWLTPLAERLARAAEQDRRGAPARSVIVLWLQGGPSQLETFDPHPGGAIGGDSRAIATAVPGVQLAAGLEQTAELMQEISLVRSVVSKEGDHERATYNAKTGFRPDPTLIHPALGAVACHQLPDTKLEIPRHVSILPGAWPARGGYLGDQFDAFQLNDPRDPIPDVQATVTDERLAQRFDSLFNVVEREFARGRLRDLDTRKTLQSFTAEGARRMMASEQLKAFDVMQAPQSLREEYGDSPFGRGCLAAVRLIETGVRCVEVTLNGWDSHANNHQIQTNLVKTLDPAFSALLRDLRRRQLLDRTLVVCGGEFGRTPTINPAGGRDHWPHGFSIALAGGGIRGGQVIGETSPDPKLDPKQPLQDVSQPHEIADIHATILAALGIDYQQELVTPIGRPMILSRGTPLAQLLG